MHVPIVLSSMCTGLSAARVEFLAIFLQNTLISPSGRPQPNDVQEFSSAFLVAKLVCYTKSPIGYPDINNFRKIFFTECSWVEYSVLLADLYKAMRL